MADPVLTSLCSICHISSPKYKCPRCSIQTCSLPCIRKHKAWTDCSGERDPTVYKPRRELRTAAGIDHDYNFLHKLETTVGQTERELVEEKSLVQPEDLRRVPPTVREVRWKVGRDGRRRRVVVTRELRETGRGGRTFERMLAQRLRRLNVRMLCAPVGMQRQKENKTTFNRKTGRVNWQVEWLGVRDGVENGGAIPARVLCKVMEDVPLYKAYHQAVEEQKRPTRGQGTKGGVRGARLYAQLPLDSKWNASADVLQEPSTGRWASAAEVSESEMWPTERDRRRRSAYDYFLANPRQRSDQPRVVTRLEVDDCLRDVLRDTNVLEFPTIFVLGQGATLPSGFVLGEKDGNDPPTAPNQRGAKRKGGQDKKGPRAGRPAKRRRQGADLEEGEVGSGNDEDIAEDSKSSVGAGGGNDDDDDDGFGAGLEAGDVLAEESLGEEESGDDDDDDSPTSSSGTDSDDSD